ncbi:MAG: hypothetical protein OEZ15_10640, partial [Gammaproteobacteria bacterium]|nr:hypothetical protein [Gammaproteobacteria bacterium]
MKHIKLTSLIVLFTALPFFTGCGGSDSGGNNATTDTTPPGMVTLLTAVAGDASIYLTWSNPSDSDFSGVVIRRSTSPFPVDATGSGTTALGVVVYDDNTNLHLDASLSNGTTYYYAAFSYDSSGNYSLAEFVSATPSSAGGSITLPGQVTGITATPANGIVDLAWSNPTDADFSGVMICVTQSATAPSSACIPSFVGNGTNSTISGLTNGTLYHFWFFSHDMTYNFTAPVSVSATPTASADTTPPADPTGFTATPGIDRDITFDWFNPANVDFKEVVILRQVGGDPVLGFSTEVYRGAGTTFTDTELSTGLNYFYGIWAVDTSLNYTATPVVLGG